MLNGTDHEKKRIMINRLKNNRKLKLFVCVQSLIKRQIQHSFSTGDCFFGFQNVLLIM